MSERIHYTRTVAPTSEPLTIDEAARQLQIAVGDDNAHITTLIQVARDVVENGTGRALMASTWVGVCAEWPECGDIYLTVAPISAVASVKYYADGDTVLTTVDSADYVVSTLVQPAQITFDDDFEYPALANRPDAVQVTFTAGATNPRNVPPSCRHAVAILVRHYYDNPSAVSVASVNELPQHLQSLLQQNRVAGWVA